MALLPSNPGACSANHFQSGAACAPLDVDLGHHRESHTVVGLAERGNFLVAARILRAELVAWKSEHHQTLFAVTLVQLFEPGELWRESALAGGVYQQQGFTLKFMQRQRFAVHLLGGKFVDGRHGFFPQSSLDRRPVMNAGRI